MPGSHASTAPFSLLSFLATTICLGDQRLDNRVLGMVEQSLGAAASSLAAMFGKQDKNVKASQRLLSNRRVDVQGLRQALYACSLENIRRYDVKTVVSVFDPTLLDFSSQNWKAGRMAIGDGNGRGYEWLNALLVEPESGRILGVGHQALASSGGLDDALDYVGNVKKQKWRAKMRRNHPNHFLVIADHVDARLPPELEVVHVADREFDDGLVLRSRAKAGARRHFVIRGNDKRIVQVRDPQWLPGVLQQGTSPFDLDDNPEQLTNVHLKDLVQHMPCPLSHSLPLDARGRVCSLGKAARVTQIELGAVPIRLARKSKRGIQANIPEEPAWLNLVVAREVSAPEGARPILWLLLTDLPTGTSEEILRIVSLYARRWRTEEFFRTEKDAMLAEDSELDDPLSTARLLVFMTFKAMFLDELRFRADIPAGVSLPKEQRRDLKSGARRARDLEMARRERSVPIPALTARERAVMALGLIAERGGWIGTSLGNYILLRGLPTFVHDVAEGRYAWLLAEDVG